MQRYRTLTLAVLITPIFVSSLKAGLFSEIVVFGDSESDSGNVFDLSGGTYPPSPPYGDGRFSNGPVWIEYLAPWLGAPVPVASRSGGRNYAYGSAQTGSGTSLTPGNFVVPNLGTQIDTYLSDVDVVDTTTLFVVFAGYNDIERGSADPLLMTSNMSDHIQDLLNIGGQNFLVPNLLEGSDQLGILRRQYNILLSAELVRLEEQYDINVFRLDIEELLQLVVNDPASYGITNLWGMALNPNTGIVVPNPEEYLWWDEIYHQTTRHHEIRAQAAYDLIVSVTSADFDADGDVDGSDFLMWQRDEVSNPPSAEDLTLWETQFGTTSTLTATAIIPEPSTLLLGALAAVGLLVRRIGCLT